MCSAIISWVTRGNWFVLGGVAAFVGGLAWLLKSTWILAGRPQPRLLFEIAPFFLALTTTCLAIAAEGMGRRRRALALALGSLGMVAGTLAAITELVDTVWGPAIAVAVLAVVISLLLQDRRGTSTERLAWWIGVATLPLNLLGGLLAIADERLLELPLAFLAIIWIWLAVLIIRSAVTTQSPP